MKKYFTWGPISLVVLFLTTITVLITDKPSPFIIPISLLLASIGLLRDTGLNKKISLFVVVLIIGVTILITIWFGLTASLV